jgi:PAS domain S-box-containing protein
MATPRGNRDSANRDKGLKATLFDSTVIREAQDATEFLANVLEASTEYSIIGKDIDGKILLWNEGARRMYGYTAEEVVGKANSDILHTPEDVALGKPREIMDAAMYDGKWEGVIGHVRKDGKRITARVVMTPRRDASGSPAGFLLISKDISNELHFTEEVHKAKLFDSAIVGTAQEAVDFITNILQASTEYSIIGMSLDGKILLWNEGARRLYGYEPEEVVGKASSESLHTPEDVADGKPREIMAAALDDGKWEGTINRIRKNGKRFTARVVITPRRDAVGRPAGFLLISKDVSDEIRLNEELRASQYYTRSLIESNIDALMTTDPLGIITDINQQMEELTGYGRDELIGTPFKNYFTNPQRAEEGIKLVLREGKVTNYELTAFSKAGRMTVVSYNASTFRDATGQLQGVFAAARDITEQKKLEEQLRESQAYNRGLIEASVDGLITVDPSGTISDVNEQMCRMSGYPREELTGTPFADYFVDAERATIGVNETFERGIVTDYVLTLATHDGRHLQVSFNASVFKDPTGSVRGIFASARDITEQSRLQSQLAEERAYNRGLIEASLDGLITVDPLLVITDVNEQMCRMSGYSRQELIGTPFPQYFSEPTRAAEGVRLTLDRGAVTNYELNLRAKDDHDSLVSFNAAVFKDQSSAVRGIFASARDITEQARLQAQLAEERAYNRALIEASVDGLVTVDESMTITDVNDTLCRMVGRQRNQLINSPFASYFIERELAEQGVRLTFNQGAVTNYVLTLQAADGHLVPVSFNAATFRDTAGRVRGIFASARDITAQQQLEVQLQASQTYTRSLIESNIDALMTTDPLGIITDVNQQMEVLTGATRDELIGTPFKNYFTEPLRAEEGIKMVLREGKVTNYELTARSKSGHDNVVSYNAATFFDRNNKLQGVFAAARDITAQKKLEEQLREQQIYLRGLIESSVDGLVTVDPDGFITDVNEQLCRMTDYGRDELIGSPFKQYFTEPERADLGVKRTMAEGVVTNYELVLRTKSGRKSVVSFNASIIRAGDGKVQGIFASARDISEQARLQTQLADQQAYNRSLIEASADALFAIAPDGIITDVNEEATRLAGFSRKHLINSRFAEYFTDPAIARIGVQETLREGRVIGYELVLITRHGRRITVSFNAGVFTDATSQPLGILAAARDITEQKQLEQQLRDQQFYTRSLIESNIDALMTTDPLGIITDVNQQMEVLTGATRDELIGTPFKNYFTEPLRAEEGIKLVLREGKVTNYELTARSKSGHDNVVSYNAATFFDRNNKLQGVFAAARDVTERKRFEKTMEEKNLELENANLAKDRFLASMSHELRTPLNAIIGFTGTLLMGLPGPLTGDQDKQLRTIQASARHLLSLINDLLDLAKIESGKVEINFEAVDCQSVVQEVASALRPLAESKGLVFETRLPTQLCVVQTDRRALSQIIINLTNNALKFTEHGQVCLELRQRQENGRVPTEVSVVDTGVGIRPEDQVKLFEAFSQVDSSAARRHEGTGLGLYLSQKLATLLQGYITFASEYGQGSTFTITLPEA